MSTQTRRPDLTEPPDNPSPTEADGSFDSGGGDYDPDLYAPARDEVPLPGGLLPGDAERLARYREQGFLAVADALTPSEVEAAKGGIDALIGGAVPGFRGIQWEGGVREKLPTMDLTERRASVRKLIYYADKDPRLTAIAEHPTILAMAAEVLGSEPTLFADQALLKPPGIGREKPWHQDKAYFDVRDGAPVVGFWIALDPTDAGNGCMHVIPGSHRGGPVVHFNRRDYQICDTEVRVTEAVAVPLDPGGVLVFDGLLHHGTPDNRSDRRRWALQLHYAPVEAMWQTKEQRAEYRANRLEVFGADGKDVTC
ncbi:phytanoyl-CoA dioxygenase family protein [Microlunatus sp. Y2014]|uniref:phytanoyl-CoA dioxygenase family protein n=1 Tax=Microlunatus sp. Y2014 TaxID=3418488 RepID=UPI003DA725B8